mgnify:CR=1 FL=1
MGRNSIVDTADKTHLFNKQFSTVAKNIRFIRTKQSPLVTYGFGRQILGFVKSTDGRLGEKISNIHFGNEHKYFPLRTYLPENLFDENFPDDNNRIARELEFIDTARQTLTMLKDKDAKIATKFKKIEKIDQFTDLGDLAKFKISRCKAKI